MMMLSQLFDIMSTQMLVNGAQLSFKIRKKSLTISSVPLICVLPFLAMFSVMQVLKFFCKNAKTFMLAELHNTQPFGWYITSFSDILPGYAHYHHSN